jgi:DNA topoisomerase-1
LFASEEECPQVGDPRDAADAAGLRYVSDEAPGIRRRRQGRGFAYLRPGGEILSDPRVLAHIRSLAIPPAWTDVWICPYADGHIQATGRDARGRKQYRYHALFREARESTKYDHLIAFARALPAIRSKVREHMGLRGLPREKVLATAVHLLETTLIRIGNGDYARQNNSYGLTTLKGRHVVIDGSEIRFRFTGKGGKQWLLKVRDRRVAKVMRACQELPGQELLQYLDETGKPQALSSGDVNAYLKEITGRDVTAKDFRTWAGTLLAALALDELGRSDSATQAKRNLRAAMERVAARLGNTATICRKCYVHPVVLTSYLEDGLDLRIKSRPESSAAPAGGLAPEEAAVLALLEERLPQDAPSQALSPVIDGREPQTHIAA